MSSHVYSAMTHSEVQRHTKYNRLYNELTYYIRSYMDFLIRHLSSSNRQKTDKFFIQIISDGVSSLKQHSPFQATDNSIMK